MTSQMIVFLGSGYLRNYNFSEIKQFKKLLICGSYAKENLKADVAKQFEEIYSVEVMEFEDKSIELFEPNSLEAELTKLLNIHPNIFLYCDDEKNLLVAAMMRDKLKLEGHKLKDVVPFRDKVIMKDVVSVLGIRVPKYASFALGKLDNNSTSYYEQIKTEFGLPFVIKPTDLAGSYGVTIVKKADDFTSLVKNIDRRVAYEVEEFITGKLYHYDAVIDSNSNIIFDETCQYIYPCAEVLEGRIYASVLLEDGTALKDRILDFGRQLVSKLKLHGVVVHFELFKKSNNDELVFLEVAIRPGGYPIYGVYQDVFDVSLFTANLFVNLGKEYTINKMAKVRYYCAGIIPSRKGTVQKLNKPLLKSTNEIYYDIAVGDKLDKAITIGHKVGNLKFYNDSKDDFNHDLDYVSNYQFLEMA